MPGLARQAPPDATLVIFHCAVLAYADPAGRRQFADAIGSLGAVWISNEGPGVAPGDASHLQEARSAYGNHCFALMRDGGGAVALTDGHGAWLHWLAAR